MTDNQEQISKSETCGHQKCSRSPWNETEYCYWHAEIDGKPIENLEKSIIKSKNSSSFQRAGPNVCPHCKRTHDSKLELELHRDKCSAEQLFCERCGEKFPERKATTDGWHYQCPTEDCTGSGLDGDLHQVDEVRIAIREDINSEKTEGGTELSGAYLSGAYLSEADVSGVDFTGANLSEADLSEADLSEADLSEADLSEADLSEADLSRAVLSEADLSEADLSEADLSRAKLLSANLNGAELAGVDLTGIDLFTEPPIAYSSGDDSPKDARQIEQMVLSMLDSRDRDTVARGLQAAGMLSDHDPALGLKFVKPILHRLEKNWPISVRVSAVRAVATIALETDTTINQGDQTFAQFLQEGEQLIRMEVLAAVSPVIIKRPTEFPETVKAIHDALDDPSPEVRLLAVQTLAVLNHDAPKVVNRSDDLVAVTEQLRGNPKVSDSATEDLTAILTTASDAGGEV